MVDGLLRNSSIVLIRISGSQSEIKKEVEFWLTGGAQINNDPNLVYAGSIVMNVPRAFFVKEIASRITIKEIS